MEQAQLFEDWCESIEGTKAYLPLARERYSLREQPFPVDSKDEALELILEIALAMVDAIEAIPDALTGNDAEPSTLKIRHDAACALRDALWLLEANPGFSPQQLDYDLMADTAISLSSSTDALFLKDIDSINELGERARNLMP